MFYFIKNKLSETFWHIFILDISWEIIPQPVENNVFFKDSFVVVNYNGLSNHSQLSCKNAKNQMVGFNATVSSLKLLHDYWKGLIVSTW